MIDIPELKFITPTPIKKISRPLMHFLRIEASGGFVLLACTVVALTLANSSWADTFSGIWNVPLTISIGDVQLNHSLQDWINEGLMTIFFFVAGLEIKRELVYGELKDKRAALLPVIAALGGMIVPALLYIISTPGQAGINGWGIPMATDIAFVIGFLSLLGKRVPHGLKVFVLSLAIVDDLGAILIIASAYSSNISIAALFLGFLGLGITNLLNRLGVRQVPVYVFVGILIWLALSFSGIHPTIAGVLLGLLTPANARIGDRAFLDVLSSFGERWKLESNMSSHKHRSNYMNNLINTAREAVSPLERLERALHPWVAFFIMPVFALANAGVPLAIEAMTTSISISVMLGLILGKSIGILLFSWLAVNLFGAQLPERVNWKILLGSGFLCGVGFTMSIFIASLALEGDFLIAGKVGTLLGSAISAIIGLGILFFVLPKRPPSDKLAT